jgi:hypothetical protein
MAERVHAAQARQRVADRGREPQQVHRRGERQRRQARHANGDRHGSPDDQHADDGDRDAHRARHAKVRRRASLALNAPDHREERGGENLGGGRAGPAGKARAGQRIDNRDGILPANRGGQGAERQVRGQQRRSRKRRRPAPERVADTAVETAGNEEGARLEVG